MPIKQAIRPAYGRRLCVSSSERLVRAPVEPVLAQVRTAVDFREGCSKMYSRNLMGIEWISPSGINTQPRQGTSC